MASICPKCRQELAEDTVCCAEVRHTWKCRKCGKRSTGFVVPYGRCFLCGGDIETIEPFKAEDEAGVGLVQEAVQMEVDTYQFYRLGVERTKDPTQKAVFEQLALMEKEHLDEIVEKYHVHIDPRVVDMPQDAEELLSSWIFQGLDFEKASSGVEELYKRALMIESCTRDHFRLRGEQLPPGQAKDLCMEFAAEEDEHIALLERELEHFKQARAHA